MKNPYAIGLCAAALSATSWAAVDADAAAALAKAPKVKMLDGSEEEHKVIASKDMGEIKNVIGWVLAQ